MRPSATGMTMAFLLATRYCTRAFQHRIGFTVRGFIALTKAACSISNNHKKHKNSTPKQDPRKSQDAPSDIVLWKYAYKYNQFVIYCYLVQINFCVLQNLLHIYAISKYNLLLFCIYAKYKKTSRICEFYFRLFYALINIYCDQRKLFCSLCSLKIMMTWYYQR